MAKTAVIAATTAAAQYTLSIADGATRGYSCTGLVDQEGVAVEVPDTAAGSTYTQAAIESENGRVDRPKLTYERNILWITGPFEGRLNKSVTATATEVTEHS